MKNFNAPQEVKDRIDALLVELHGLCAEHRIPYVAACVTANDDTGEDQVLSVLLNGEEDLVPISVAAAFEVLNMPFIPEPLFDFILEVAEDLAEEGADDDTECDCDACQFTRSAAAGLH